MVGCLPCMHVQQQGAVGPAGVESLLQLRNADVTQTPDTHSQLGDSQLFVVSGARVGVQRIECSFPKVPGRGHQGPLCNSPSSSPSRS